MKGGKDDGVVVARGQITNADTFPGRQLEADKVLESRGDASAPPFDGQPRQVDTIDGDASPSGS